MKINEIQKSYKRKKVLDITDFDVNQKGIIGILGVNGAGKTTFFKMVTNYVLGNISNTYKDDVSYFIDDSNFFYGSIERTLKICDVTFMDFDINKAIEMLAFIELDIQKPIKSLSRGQKVLLNLCLTISRNTSYYFIDELYSNLDFETREMITKLIIEHIDVVNKTVFISSHEIYDIERIIDYVMVLHNKRFTELKGIKDLEIGETLYDYFEGVVGGHYEKN